MPALLEFSTCLLLSASLIGLAPPPTSAPAVHPSPVSRDGRRTLSRLPANLLRGAAGVCSRDGFPPLLIGAGATGLASFLDDEVRDSLADPDHGFGTSLETTGNPLYSGVAVAGLFAASRFADNMKFRAVSYDLLNAFIVNWGYCTALKHAIHRERPDGSDNVSFPSGPLQQRLHARRRGGTTLWMEGRAPRRHVRFRGRGVEAPAEQALAERRCGRGRSRSTRAFSFSLTF